MLNNRYFWFHVNFIVLCIFSRAVARSKAEPYIFSAMSPFLGMVDSMLVCWWTVCSEFQGDDFHHKRGTVLRAHGKLDFSIHSFTAACLDFSSDDGQM